VHENDNVRHGVDLLIAESVILYKNTRIILFIDVMTTECVPAT